MSPISRGFRGRRREVDPSRVPPGQYTVDDFPVLSAGPTPHTPLDEWSLTVHGYFSGTAPLLTSRDRLERVDKLRARASSS